jgi:hypothetical protein
MTTTLETALIMDGPNQEMVKDQIDIREQLYNNREVGTLVNVQLPQERIVRLHGVLFDLDPKRYRPGNGCFEPADTPQQFFSNITPVLARHPLVSQAEIRCSGTGLHAILWIDPPIELETAAEQSHWAAAVKAIQRTLPVDPCMPGITALTRAVGSINPKNGVLVETFRKGNPVKRKQVEEYLESLIHAPFRMVAGVLLGGEKIDPCPLCQRKGRKLAILDRQGRCYSGCGMVRLDKVFDLVFAQPEAVAAHASIAKSDC